MEFVAISLIFLTRGSLLVQELENGVYTIPSFRRCWCRGLFQVKELMDIIGATENTTRSQVLAATTSLLFDLASTCMIC